MSWAKQQYDTATPNEVKQGNARAMAEVRAVVEEYQGRNRPKETHHQDEGGVAGLASGYLDIEYIRGKVSVVEVARELGLRVKSRTVAHCWRVDNHRNGDADPSIRFQLRKNRWCCFVCDLKGAASNIDLVMGVLACDFRSAVNWITERWPVPSAVKGKHVKVRRGWNPAYRVEVNGNRIEWLVRSCFWAELTPEQRSILVVLDAFTDRETGLATISYRGLCRYAGVGSHATIRRALLRFQRVHLLEIERGVGSDGFRSVSSYRLVFEASAFVAVLNETYTKQREEIEIERAFRSSERKRTKCKSLKAPVSTCTG